MKSCIESPDPAVVFVEDSVALLGQAWAGRPGRARTLAVARRDETTMDAALAELKRAICVPADLPPIDAEAVRRFVEGCVVALPVGGEGTRLQAVSEAQGVQKNALRLPNGDTMLERTIRMYKDVGIERFVALVHHRAESILDLLGDGSRLGVDVRYSRDPGRPVGRGGAIRNALDNGRIDRGDNLIVHNPDDVIVRYPGRFPEDIVAAHLGGTAQGTIATAVMVDGFRLPYTGMTVEGGVVSEVTPYPIVPIPAHIGVTVLSPECYPYFDRLFDMQQRTDFEGPLFRALSAERRLFAAYIPSDSWLQVNDPKGLQSFMAFLEAEERRAAT
jgi:NDP-sugar pyrophosphorylase family protein